MKAKIRGTEIYFDVAGVQCIAKGKKLIERPVLFLLHGGPGGDHLRYKSFALPLQEVAQLVFIDHRGCGQSKKTTFTDYTLENNIEDIEALRKHLGLKKICLLGTSYGGIVAQGYATRYPKNVEKLILVATSPSYRFIFEAKQNLEKYGTPQQIAAAEPLWKGSFKNPETVNEFFKIMEPLYSHKAKYKKKKVYTGSPTVWSHEALNEGFGGFLKKFDFLPKLHRIKCPTLILAGKNDWICDPSQSREIAKKIPHAKLKIFRKCGHAIGADAPKLFLKNISRFLKE